ncbi:MAG: helix-turn-helix transcriptional regulator [Eubacteriales bacterium]
MEFKSMGSKMQFYRKRARISQEQLAEEIEVSRNYISAIERGVKTPSLETFIKISNVLGVSADILLEGLIDNAYEVRASILADQISQLVVDDQERVLNVVEAMVK